MTRLGNFFRQRTAIWRVIPLFLISCAVVSRGWSQEVEKELPAGAGIDLETRVDRLIELLGSPYYATRQKAKADLERLRLDAFDALNEAQHSDDIEIALSARYLVRGMQVNWFTDEDAVEIKQLLRDYGSHEESERRSLMEQLAGLPLDKCLRPLCRLVRYEDSEHLSRKAALLVMSLDPPVMPPARMQLALSLVSNVGKSKREAANWLRAYADLLGDSPSALERWDALIAREEEQLALNPNQTSQSLTRDLLKWYADQLSQRQRDEEATAVMRRTISLLNTTREEVLDAVDWFRARENWLMITEIADRFPDTFTRNPMLQYRLAETYMKLGNQEQADKTAHLAMQSIPEELDKHLLIAFNLQQDGLFEWAEREYRHVAQQVDVEPVEALRARYFLSEMLHDAGKEREAGDTLAELVELVESQEGLRNLLESDVGREVGSIKSRMHFFYARQYGKENDFARQREALLEGLKNDPFDVDILIAMYGVSEADADWKETTRERIREAAERFRKEIHDLTRQMDGARPAEDRAIASFQLASNNNQLAWLIANTEGDFDEAIRCSLRSLELQPDKAGFLDTLGRCYYAKGDYENAVRYQVQAAAKEPHSPAIVAQLELFQRALQQQQAATQETIAAPPGK